MRLIHPAEFADSKINGIESSGAFYQCLEALIHFCPNFIFPLAVLKSLRLLQINHRCEIDVSGGNIWNQSKVPVFTNYLKCNK